MNSNIINYYNFLLFSQETATTEEVPEEHVIIKKICYSPPASKPRSISISPTESFSNLPTKKRLPLIQYSNSNMDSNGKCIFLFHNIICVGWQKSSVTRAKNEGI